MQSDIETSVLPLSLLTNCDAAEWQRLVDASMANFSLGPDWLRITATSHGLVDRSRLLMVRKGTHLVGVMPIEISRTHTSGIPLRKLGLVSNYVSYHNSLIGSIDAAEAIDLLLNFAAQNAVHVVHFSGILDDSRLAEVIMRPEQNDRYIIQRITGEASPFLKLDLSWDDMLASKPKKFRYKLRKRTDALTASGDLSIQWFNGHDECANLLNVIRIIERNSWKHDAGISIFERAHEKRYYELLLPFLVENEALVANVLFHANNPIAYNLCCLWNGWMGQLKTSFDASYAELSPGSIVIDEAIRCAIQLGANEFDFLGNTDPHKLAWTKTVRPHSDYFLFLRNRLRSRLIGSAKKIRDRTFKARKAAGPIELRSG